MVHVDRGSTGGSFSPPPIPDDSGWTAPTQSSAVMAASTAEPPLLRMSADKSEQMGTSVATPPVQW